MTPGPLAHDVSWLHSRLDESITAAAHEDVQHISVIAQRMLETGKLDATLADLSNDRIDAILKLLTMRFHLRNKAEQLHITRVNQERERKATTASPRAESLADAVWTLASNGATLEQVVETVSRLDIQPTLTAHPTESRRRSVIAKQDRIAELLTIRNSGELAMSERKTLESSVRQTLSQLMATDEIRSRRLDVSDEVRNGVHYLGGSIWKAVPSLYRDLADAIENNYGERIELPVMLRYRSWIGGDRDGNPFVTAERSAVAFADMRNAACDGHRQMLKALHRELSLSSRRVQVDPKLTQSIDRDEAQSPLNRASIRHFELEPFRVKLSHMQMRLGTPTYDINQYIDDLVTIQNALEFANLTEIAHRGGIADALVAARTFGFHLAALDTRQHSQVHEAAVHELFALAGVCDNYATLDALERSAVLEAELSTARPLLARGHECTAQTHAILEELTVFAQAIERDPNSVGSYIISMAHDLSDVLEVLVLLREVGLWTIENGTVRSSMDVVPLFETVDDLDCAGSILTAMLESEAYKAQLEARGSFQEIMLGYSDSNKDGGYWAANWRLHTAQQTLARIAQDAGVSFRFFHGRGGTVARGGGRANRAILACPPETRNGRIRFTEQGEVISFRYAMPEVAHRHLEQIVNAMMLATTRPGVQSESDQHMMGLMNDIADLSRSTYRSLIDDEGFWPIFVERSPVLHIGDLPIASRPVSRAGSDVTFEHLRAIPWVFAWTQMRYNAPGWYGTGSAFNQLVIEHESALHLCRVAYSSGGFFRAFIDNAQQEMSRARLQVARWYTDGCDPAFHQRLADEFGLAEQAVLLITGQQNLLDNNKVIQRLIHERNTDADIINALQVELLRRWRAGDDDPKLKTLILLSVNALAAAMQSTG